MLENKHKNDKNNDKRATVTAEHNPGLTHTEWRHLTVPANKLEGQRK